MPLKRTAGRRPAPSEIPGHSGPPLQWEQTAKDKYAHIRLGLDAAAGEPLWPDGAMWKP